MSVLLFVLAIVLWIRSYWVFDRWEWFAARDAGDLLPLQSGMSVSCQRWIQLDSNTGSVHIVWSRGTDSHEPKEGFRWSYVTRGHHLYGLDERNFTRPFEPTRSLA